MGAYSTIKVTRKTALELYLKSLIDLDKITNEELEQFLDNKLEKSLYNAWVVGDDYEYGKYELSGDVIARSNLNNRAYIMGREV